MAPFGDGGGGGEEREEGCGVGVGPDEAAARRRPWRAPRRGGFGVAQQEVEGLRGGGGGGGGSFFSGMDGFGARLDEVGRRRGAAAQVSGSWLPAFLFFFFELCAWCRLDGGAWYVHEAWISFS